MSKISELSQLEFAAVYRRWNAARRLAKKLERKRAAQNREKMR